MNSVTILAIRGVIGVFFAFILLRIFRPEVDPFYSLPLAAFLVGTAYGLDYMRKRKSTDKGQFKS